MTANDRWRRLRAELEVFQSRLATQLPRLEIRAGYDTEWSSEEFREARRDGRYDAPGVYVIFSADGTLLCVGSATDVFDKRIFRHGHEQARFIDLIPFEPRYSYLGLALERFLVVRLQPRSNTPGVGYVYE